MDWIIGLSILLVVYMLHRFAKWNYQTGLNDGFKIASGLFIGRSVEEMEKRYHRYKK